MPWSSASEGRVVSEDELKEIEEPIIWTLTGLKSFWEFLINIHSLQSVGPISLSFHIAPAPSECRAENHDGVLDQDHIKIRHDVSFAMNIRTMLDAWKYTITSPKRGDGERGDGTSHQPQPRKIRPLRGAKLVLVDDCSEGLMVL